MQRPPAGGLFACGECGSLTASKRKASPFHLVCFDPIERQGESGRPPSLWIDGFERMSVPAVTSIECGHCPKMGQNFQSRKPHVSRRVSHWIPLTTPRKTGEGAANRVPYANDIFDV